MITLNQIKTELKDNDLNTTIINEGFDFMLIDHYTYHVFFYLNDKNQIVVTDNINIKEICKDIKTFIKYLKTIKQR